MMHKEWQQFTKKYPGSEASFSVLSTKTLLADLSGLGLIKVSGPDAIQFLQGQLTCHLEKITQAKGSLCAHCNPQGRIISLFYLFQYQDSYYLLMPRSLLSIAISALKKYAVFYKTELTEANDSLIILGYSGVDISSVMENNVALICIEADQPMYVIAGEMENMKTVWEQLSKQASITSYDTWKCLSIQNGIPFVYPQTSGKFLPHDLNLQQLGALHFDKGCYTGQEIIARMHYRGKLKNHMYTAKIAIKSPPLPGTDIYSRQSDEKRICGSIVDVCHEDNNHYSLLIVTDDASAKNNGLFLNDESHFLKIVNEKLHD